MLSVLLLCTATFTMGFRTLGELAHPKAKYSRLLKEIGGKSGALEKAQFIVDEEMFAAALIGTLEDSDKRNGRLAEFCRLNGEILLSESNKDKPGPGRTLGITTVV